MCYSLKIRVSRSPRERDHVPDVAHSGHEEKQSLETESESAVRHASEPSGINVSFEVLPAHAELVYPVLKLLE